MIRGKPNPRYLTVGQRLKLVRESAEIKAAPLSLAAGLSGSTVFNIEEGHRVPKVDTIERLAMVLKVSPGWLAFAPLRAEPAPMPPIEEGAPMLCSAMADRLRGLRTDRGLSARALARASGLADTAVRMTEEGRTLPTVATAEALAKGLGVSPAWLAYGEGPQVLPKVPRQRKVKSAPKAERRRRPAKRGSPPARRRTAPMSSRTKGAR
jgi:transcriptional regulator with XRE-family HTH domain